MKNKRLGIIFILLALNLVLIGVFGSRIIGLFPGWHKDSKGEYYTYKFGEKLKGIKSINDNILYFDENGYRQVGFVEYEGNKYYFYPEG